MQGAPERSRKREPAMRARLAGVAACAAATFATAAEAPKLAVQPQAAPPASLVVAALPTIEVIGGTLLPGLGIPLAEVPGNVQRITAEDMARRGADGIVQSLDALLNGVSTADAQGNAHQAGLTYRGFSVSPVLGAPQSLAVFVDGVRWNEPFGDTVNWDLLAPNAIATADLVSGSSPVYGLNALGGALALETKSGLTHPGVAARLLAGSFGRRGLQMEAGGHGENVNGFVAANVLDETGWRRHSQTSLRQLFGRVGWRDAKDVVDVTLALADNTLRGTQALPASMLDDRRQPYTWPDRTDNAMHALAVRGQRILGEATTLGWNVFDRRVRTTNVSSNVNDDFDTTQPAGAGNPTGFNDRNRIVQSQRGGGLQLTFDGRLAARPNQLAIGGSFERGVARYTQDEAEAAFVDDRNTVDAGDYAPRVAARVVSRRSALWIVDRWSIAERVTLTGSGRYAVNEVRIEDRSGTAPQLEGDHTFRRFSPAIALAWRPVPTTTLHAGASESMRTPTPMELTCADPAVPCKLPTGFLADPPLKPVIARTFEAGARGRLFPGASKNTTASLVAWRTVSQDDIQFVSSGGLVNAGYFANVGETVRQGVDLALGVTLGTVRLAAGWSRVDARYGTDFTVHSPNNSSADANGDIAVARGNRIPGVPSSTIKLRADWQVTPGWTLSGAWRRYGAQFLRGDENNADANGRMRAWSLVDVSSAHRLARDWDVVLRVDNLLDRRYETFGVLGENFFRGAGNTFDASAAAAEPFRTPGAPRAGWVYLRFTSRR